MYHMFDVEIAKQVGVIAAILFHNIAFWCQHSMANDKNWNDGRYWTFNTNKAFCEMFPYLSSKMIRTALQKLVDAGLIVTGNYNRQAYDRTMWYALTEKGNSIFQISKKDLPVAANGFDRSGEPIPDINPDISNNINSNISIRRSRAVNMIPDGFDEFWKAYPKKVAKQDAVRAFKKLKPNAETVEAIIADVKARTSHEWNGKELQYIPHPATYLRGKRWEDETEVTQIAGRSEPDPIVLTDEEERIIDEIYARNGRDAFM